MPGLGLSTGSTLSADGSAKTDLVVTSEDEEQLQTSRLLVLNSPALGQSSLRFFSPIIFVPSFPRWRSAELSSLPVCKPHRVLHLNIFLFPIPCCCEGLGHDGAFHPSFPLMIQSWWLLASALGASVVRWFVVLWYGGGEMLGTLLS